MFIRNMIVEYIATAIRSIASRLMGSRHSADPTADTFAQLERLRSGVPDIMVPMDVRDGEVVKRSLNEMLAEVDAEIAGADLIQARAIELLRTA